MVSKKLSTFYFGIILVLVSGCFQEFRDIEGIKEYNWEPTVAAPLISSTFGFEDLVNETGDSTSIFADENGLLTFVYEDQVLSKTAENLYNIENQDFQYSNTFPNPILVQYNLQSAIEFSETIEFDFAVGTGQEIDSILLKDGFLSLDLNWNFNQPGEFEITFLSLEQNSQPLTLTHQFFGAVNYSESISLNGFKADLTGPGNSTNKFRVEVRFLIINDGSFLPPNPGYDMNLTVFAPRFNSIFGELGSISFSTNKGLTELSFFEDFQFGTINLVDPKAVVTFTNSFGLGVTTYLDKFYIRHEVGESILEGQITTDPIILEGVPLENIGQSITSSVEINNQNSNLPDLIQNIPKEVSLQFSGVIENPGSRDFLLDSSKIAMDLMVELPFYGNVSDLRLEHEFDFDGSVFEDLDNAIIRFYTSNELPIGLTIQASFLNASGLELLEVFGNDNNLILASQNDMDGKVVNIGESTVFLDLDKGDLEVASRAEFLRLSIEVNTFDNGTVPVKILDSHKISFEVGLQTKLSTND